MRKTLIVQGMRARFVLGWVGLASTDDQHRHKTPDWIFKTLFEMNAVELSIEDIANRLQFLATTHFAKLTALDMRTLFVMAGWEKSEPFVCIVSNYVSLKNAESETRVALKHHIPSFEEARVAAPLHRGALSFDAIEQAVNDKTLPFIPQSVPERSPKNALRRARLRAWFALCRWHGPDIAGTQ
jgi:hypothetical protein